MSKFDDHPWDRLRTSPAFADPTEEGEAETAPPGREGLPPGYRMRADSHYVDLLASRGSTGRERVIDPRVIDAPPLADAVVIAPLVESVRRYGLLQPLLVQERGATYRLIAGRKRLAAAQAAGLREVPCVMFTVDDEQAAKLAQAASLSVESAATPEPDGPPDTTLHAGAELAQALTSLATCAEMLSSPGSALSRTIVSDLIRTEAWRASTLLHATRVIRQELQIVRRAVPIPSLLDRVARNFLPERRLRGVDLFVRSEIPDGTIIAGDEQLLAGALSGALIATLALTDGVSHAAITISGGLVSSRITIEISQNTVAAPAAWSSRAFDEHWTSRPGGIPALVAMLALRRSVEQHRGVVSATAGPDGTRISISLPTGT